MSKKKGNNSSPFINDNVLDNQNLGNNQNIFRENVGGKRAIVDQEETIVNNTTTRHTIRRVHPTNNIKVNRNVCPNRFDQVRRIFTGCELLRVTEFNNEFFKRFGRFPTTAERRGVEESCVGISDIDSLAFFSKSRTC
ncbi:hypothetical protein SFC65_27425 [Priestia filamentosa]|uniref:hypothetical protein n=1 Tax=Priestia filamentosa TaxID=1402861 RepID=UPI00398245F2